MYLSLLCGEGKHARLYKRACVYTRIRIHVDTYMHTESVDVLASGILALWCVGMLTLRILSPGAAILAGASMRPRTRAAACIVMQQSTGIFSNEMLSIVKGSKTYLVGADIKRNKYKTLESTWSVEDSLAELEVLKYI